MRNNLNKNEHYKFQFPNINKLDIFILTNLQNPVFINPALIN